MSYREFENTIPIDDPLVVLDLLCNRWGRGGTTREIVRVFERHGGGGHRKGENPYVEVGHHRDFSDSTYYRFEVTSRVCDELLSRGLVVGKPQWGYTDMNTLRVSEWGERLLWDTRSKLELDDRLRADWWYERGSL